MRSDLHRSDTEPARWTPPAAGFSYIELVIAMGIILVAMAAAFSLVAKFNAAMGTESTTLATQQSGRVIMDELTRHLQQIGYNIRRPNAFNPGSWQQGIVYGGAHHLVFNGDINASIGWLPSGESIDLPGGGTYTGEGMGATTAGAETYVYTLDANGDDTIDAKDRSEFETGNYNPANLTDNPLDYALFRRVYGYNGTDYGGDLQPLGPYILSNAAGDFSYPDGGTPDLLFTYWMTEDLNGDGVLSNDECVNDQVDTCPPSADREPLLYIWGDTNFDGALSEAEKTALLSMEVASASWSKNPLVASGSYKSTTIATQTDPSSATPYEIQVTDGTKLGEGYLIQIGTGNAAEFFYVEQIATSVTPHRVMLTSDVERVHTVGTTIQVLPDTLLRAVRTVGVAYTAVADKKDMDGGHQAVGRLGREGDRGMDYRVSPYRRQVEVVNAPTSATSPDTAPSGADVCPLLVVDACTNSVSGSSIRYTSGTGAQDIEFLVTDLMGNPMSDVSVVFTHTDSTIGTIADLTVKSNDSGIAAASYSTTGVLGKDKITASIQCTTGGTTYTADAENEVTFYEVITTLEHDCLTTVSDRVSTPTTDFKVQVNSPDGPAANHDLKLGLAFDPSYLPSSPDFTSLSGELYVDGTSLGTTDSTGKLDGQDVTTDGNGEIVGRVDYSAAAGVSARLNLAALVSDSCSSGSSSVASEIDYFTLTHDSTLPSPGCTSLLPCQITGTMPAPKVGARLSWNGQPIPNADLTFTTKDVQAPSDISETAASEIIPDSGVQTDSNGDGEAIVSNNASPLITPLNQLKTQVEVSSGGDPLMCSSGDIVTSSPTTQFNFEAPANVCNAEVVQMYVQRERDDEICVHVKNDNDTDGCPMTIKGIQFSIYDSLGLNLDTSDGSVIKQIEGGGVSSTADCSNDDDVRIFKDDCKDPKALLANNEPWPFKDGDGCSEPYLTVGPQEFFHLPAIQFDDDYPEGRPMDVTIYFECGGDCDTGTTEYKTFRVTTPY